jgi:cytochrome c biogenesis protein CcmG, thiol:disulfide interchange protein DsbE
LTTVGSWSRFAARQRWLVCGLLILALGGAASADGRDVTPLLKSLDLRGYSPGTVSPAFTALTVEARTLSTAELRGKIVFLNFWASWCSECRPEMPILERVHREFALQGLTIIGINAREHREVVQRYGKDLGLTFPLVLDSDGKIGTAYGLVALPTTFIVGRDGRAIALAVGPRDWMSAPARAIIEQLLAEPSLRPRAR